MLQIKYPRTKERNTFPQRSTISSDLICNINDQPLLTKINAKERSKQITQKKAKNSVAHFLYQRVVFSKNQQNVHNNVK